MSGMLEVAAVLVGLAAFVGLVLLALGYDGAGHRTRLLCGCAVVGTIVALWIVGRDADAGLGALLALVMALVQVDELREAP